MKIIIENSALQIGLISEGLFGIEFIRRYGRTCYKLLCYNML
jgi:hypothetical protein